MTYEVQQTRWDRLIRRVSGSIGPGSRVSETLSELFPVLDVERVPGELLVLSGTNLAFGAAVVTGAAGEIPNAILFNPAASGNVLTITGISVGSDIADRIRMELITGISGSGIATQAFRDGRLIDPNNVPVGNVRTLSNPSQLAGRVDFPVVADTPVFVSDPNGIAVVSPDTSFRVGSVTIATTIVVTFFWRERPAQESELSL